MPLSTATPPRAPSAPLTPPFPSTRPAPALPLRPAPCSAKYAHMKAYKNNWVEVRAPLLSSRRKPAHASNAPIQHCSFLAPQQNEIFRENQFHTWSINKGNIVPLLVLAVVAPLTMCGSLPAPSAHCRCCGKGPSPPAPFTPPHAPPLPRHYFVKNEHGVREQARGLPITPRL